MTHKSRFACTTLLAVVLSLVTACDRHDPGTAPGAKARGIGAALLAPEPYAGTESQDESPGRAFYPLQIGNHWHYAVTVQLTWLPTSTLPDSVMIFHWTRARDLMCTETLSGREYLVEQRTEWRPDLPPQILWAGLRQDRSGLYEAYPPDFRPPECLGHAALTADRSPASPAQPGGRPSLAMDDLPGSPVDPSTPTSAGPAPEQFLLQYPLHTGAEWQMNGGTRIRVEGVDVLSLPAGRYVAHRLGVQARWMRPGDTLHLWYGRAGYLASHLHYLQYPELGPPIYWRDELEVLDTLALKEPPHPHH